MMVTMERKTPSRLFTVTVTAEIQGLLNNDVLYHELRDLATIHREAATSVDELAQKMLDEFRKRA